MCTELVAMCEVCKFFRHMFWDCCKSNVAAKVEAAKVVDTPGPDPADCPDLKEPVVRVKIRPEACPTDNPKCGGLRNKKHRLLDSSTATDNTIGAGNAATQDQEQEQEQIHNHNRNQARLLQQRLEEDPDVAVTSYNIIEPNTPLATRIFLLGPKSCIKYAKNYKEAGEKGWRHNKDNMNMTYALHNGYTRSDPSQLDLPEDVRPIADKYVYKPDTLYFREWRIKWPDVFPPDSIFVRIEHLEAELAPKNKRKQPESLPAPPSPPEMPARPTKPRDGASGFMPRIEEEDKQEDHQEGVGQDLDSSADLASSDEDLEPQLIQELFLGG